MSWIPNKHYSGVYGLLKLILPEVLAVEKVLVLDTDVTVLTDLADLWDIFDQLKNNQMLALVENQSDWYIKMLDNGLRPWPAIGRGFNTGIMLMNLKLLQNKKFLNMWTTVTQNTLKEFFETSLADQDIINAVITENPMIIFTLECIWNVQLSDHTLSDQCYNSAKQIRVCTINTKNNYFLN